MVTALAGAVACSSTDESGSAGRSVRPGTSAKPAADHQGEAATGSTIDPSACATSASAIPPECASDTPYADTTVGVPAPE
ncbi:hypothetical protein STTU_1013 [Streptomyces sp. Tu6071]|nr:hypothetical protein STTU_1013 [Streptomyces sp. Tu6071]